MGGWHITSLDVIPIQSYLIFDNNSLTVLILIDKLIFH
jgi:hypothetical protein